MASRQQATWRLRLAFATGALLACAFGLLLPHITPRERGQTVLVCLAGSALALSLFAGSYLTADSVSVEKREGTLGLLFLTPLNGWQIIMGKMVSHSLQVGCAWLAIFPVFFMPVLHGGVTWSEVARLLLALLATLLLSLACGMFWSTWCTEARSSVLASAASMLALNFLPWLPPFLKAVFLNRGFRFEVFTELSPMTPVFLAFDANYRWAGGAGGTSGSAFYWGAVAVSLVLCAALVGASGWLLPRLWRRAESGEPHARGSFLRRLLRGQPRDAGVRRRIALPALPCHWLALRGIGEAFWLRMFRYGGLIFFGAMLFVSVVTQHWEEGFITAFLTAYGLHAIGRVQSALAVTRRLHEDRRSGALELLLVTPVTDWEILEAHHSALKRALRGIYRSLLGMNIALQAMVVLFPGQLHMRGGEWAIFSVFFAGGAVLTVADFWALRWLGLREALRATTHLKAAGKTFGLLVVGPWLAFGLTFLAAIQFRNEEEAAVVFSVWVLFCLLVDWLLVRQSRAWLRPGLRRRASESA